MDIQNGKIYIIFPTGWHLIPEQARLYSFMVLPTPTSVPQMQLHPTVTGTKPPVVESTRIPRTSDVFTPGILPVISDVMGRYNK